MPRHCIAQQAPRPNRVLHEFAKALCYETCIRSREAGFVEAQPERPNVFPYEFFETTPEWFTREFAERAARATQEARSLDAAPSGNPRSYQQGGSASSSSPAAPATIPEEDDDPLSDNPWEDLK